MAPTISTLALLTLFASSTLTSPTQNLEARKPPSLTYVDQNLEDDAGKACAAWSVWKDPVRNVVRPICNQWVPDERETSHFGLVTGIFEGTCYVWNVRITDSKQVLPECAKGEQHEGDGE
ncbi:hypothetical protein AC578_1693 [Pseudocercospora eumusae]|uniref:Uncharacterized protein n=1 Tax=Pseudocercospora eumusae TaxID=321146 RepID=A0A139GUP5_9PEZI|nr:hypothetical protein AC578_1693 [Pseudocercospora eumusae]